MFKGCVAFRCITEGITVVRSKTKTAQEKARVAPRRETLIIKDIINKKEAKMSIKEMTNYMADIKKMNVAQAKQHIDKHVNVAMEIKER